METKKHIQSQKKVTKAVSAFDKAIVELNKGTELLAESMMHDSKTLETIETTIENLWKQHDQVQADIIYKQGEIKKQVDLSVRLSEFTL